MSTARVDFTRGAAERIASVVRTVEQGDRDQSPLRLGRAIDSDSGNAVSLRRATFTGEWPVGATRTVTLVNSTQTALVTNYCVPSVGEAGERTVIFGRASGTNSVLEISGPDEFCGTYQGPNLVTLSFEACHGSGASAVLLSPGGDAKADSGPLGQFLLSGGGGYALRARVEPTLAVTGGGSGAKFVPTLAQKTGDCGLPYWEIETISVTGGSGYVDGEQLKIETTGGAIVELPANVTLSTKRTAPTITASSPVGSNATLSVITKSLGGDPETWQIASLSVSGGTNFPDKSEVTITVAANVVVTAPGQAFIRGRRAEPVVSAVAANGSGAVLAPVLSKSVDNDGRPVWAVSSINVTSGGANYNPNAPISVSVTDGIQLQAASAIVQSVHTATGAILSAQVLSGGAAYKATGQPDFAVVPFGGIYHSENPLSVTVNGGGRYYLENPAGTPYKAGVTVTIQQTAPSSGSGGVIEPVINTDTNDPGFGRIESLNVTNAGTAYLAWEAQSDIVYAGVQWSDIEGFDKTATQILGHVGGGCLRWYDIVDCGEEEEEEEEE